MKRIFLLIGCAVLVSGCMSNAPSTQSAAPIMETGTGGTAVTTIPSVHQHNLPTPPSDSDTLPSPDYPEYSNIIRNKNMSRSKNVIHSKNVQPVVCKTVPKAKTVSKSQVKAKVKSKSVAKTITKKPVKKVAKVAPKLKKKPVSKATAKKKIKSKPAVKTKSKSGSRH